MKRILIGLFSFVLCISSALAYASETNGLVNIIGHIHDDQKLSVQTAKIVLYDMQGAVVAETYSNADGRYALRCVTLGRYRIGVNSPSGWFQGQTAVVDLHAQGAIVDWWVSPRTPALALSRSGGGSCESRGEVSASQTFLLGPLGLVGAGIGGAGASGTFGGGGGSGGNTFNPPVSPAQ